MSAGHTDPWSYTLTQLNGFLLIYQSRENEKYKALFTLMRVANHGDKKAVEKLEKELSRNG